MTYLKTSCTSKYQLKLGKCFECFTLDMRVYVGSAMKYNINSCQKAWTGHMACKQKCKQKMAWSHIKAKG